MQINLPFKFGIIIINIFIVGLFTQVVANAFQAEQTNSSKEMHAMQISESQERMFYKTSFDEEISLEIEKESLDQALLTVSKKAGLRLTFKGDILSYNKKISLHNKNISISEALTKILDETDLDFYFSKEGYLLIQPSHLEDDIIFEQQEISGTVVDDANGEPLPGVNIIVKDQPNIGTTTNIDGEYSLEVPDEANVLVFSFIGFETQEIEINGRNRINVVLTGAVLPGEELVVVGYGFQKKRDLTGSVSRVEGEELVSIPSSSVEDALQGKIAGVQVLPVDGRPGQSPEIRIRGVGTLNNSSPLFVVDGLLLDDISFLDSKDIESVDVLKDASSTAIYGSRGANGVVIVTTKKGRRGDTQISMRSTFGFQEVANELEVANAREFATLVNESEANAGRSPIFENPEAFDEGTDWQDLIFRDAAPTQNYQLSVRGGNDNSIYFVSANYFQQDGVVRESSFQRVNLRVNNEYFASDNVTVGHNVTFNFQDQDSEAQQPIITQALRADPTTRPFDDEGNFFDTTINGASVNPVASQQLTSPETITYSILGDAFANITFLENFRLRSSFGLNLRRSEFKEFIPEFDISTLQRNPDSRINVRDTKITQWNSQNTLNYINDWGDHAVNVLSGLTFEEFKFEDLGGSRINIPGSGPEFFFLDAGEEEGQTNFNSSNAWGIISFLGRVNYSYKDRYLVTASFRRDGSSRFADRNRWGNFPSAALGWVISSEPFFEDVPYISFLKLRTSWGITGNDKIDTNAAIPTVNDNTSVFGENEDIRTGRTISRIANPNLRWEETTQYDVGLEINFLNEKFTTELDWFRRQTDDILIDVPIPGSVGAFAPVINAADVVNRGFELTLQWREQRRNFSYSIGFNGTTIHNEVKSLGQGLEEIFDGGTRNLGFTTRTATGQPIGSFFGFKVDGVFQTQEDIDNSPSRPGDQPGDLKLVDLNGDGVIDSDDRTDLGSPIPDFVYGFNLAGSYKNFDLAMDFDGQTGNQILNARLAIRGFRVLNYDRVFLDRWTGPGTSNTVPRITEGGNNFETDRFLEDGGFLRLRNIQLGYTLPINTLGLDFSRIRFFANATNVFTKSDFNGFNPQVAGRNQGSTVTASGIADENLFPIARTYTFGVEVDF